MSDISTRKEDHLELCATGDVGYHQTSTLLSEVQLLHDPLPELSLAEVDTSCQLLGKPLAAPLMLSAMTGGTERTGEINRELAALAEELGLGFALGSQRPMLRDPAMSWTYQVRPQAPTALIVGNLGLWQARELGPSAVDALAREAGADALAVHLNPAQELVQPGGDRDFRGGVEALITLAREMEFPLIVKETGCGLGPATMVKLLAAGISHLDVAGAGGTSWIAVEGHRASTAEGRQLGQSLREWGVPTAVATAGAARAGFSTVIASGGVVDGLDAARALALGANAVGIARPVLKAYWRGGVDEARRHLREVLATLRAVMLLTGSSKLSELRKAPRVLGPTLESWLAQLT